MHTEKKLHFDMVCKIHLQQNYIGQNLFGKMNVQNPCLPKVWPIKTE